MSDVPETPDGAAEAAQGAVEHAAPETTSPPWGDDFNPERAWSTIQNLRGREKELSQHERTLNSLRSDPEEFARFAAELGYEFDAGEPDDDPGFDVPQDDPVAAKVAELEQWKQQQELERLASAINSHIDELAKGDGVELTDRERQILYQQATLGEISEAATERAFKDHVEWLRGREDAWQKRYLESKRGEMPPPTGTAGEAQFDRNDPQAREARMAAILQARAEAQGS